MRRKILSFLLMVAVTAFVIGMSHHEACALAEAGVGNCAWANPGAHAWSNCNGGNPCAFHDPGQTPPNRNAFCSSMNTRGTWVESEANTYAIPKGWALTVRVDGLVEPGDWMWGKGEPGLVEDVHITDTIRVDIDTTYSGYVVRTVTGYIEVYPKRWINSWLDFNLKAGNATNPDSIFHNHGHYSIEGFLMEGYPPVGFTDNSTINTLKISISDVDTIPCGIPYQQLCSWLKKGERVTNVPTLTQWGVIVLVALLTSSAVFITLKKRRKATLAA